MAGKSAHILFEVRMGGGDMITFIQSPPFDIPGELKSISIKKARIIDGDGQEYSIGA